MCRCLYALAFAILRSFTCLRLSFHLRLHCYFPACRYIALLFHIFTHSFTASASICLFLPSGFLDSPLSSTCSLTGSTQALIFDRALSLVNLLPTLCIQALLICLYSLQHSSWLVSLRPLTDQKSYYIMQSFAAGTSAYVSGHVLYSPISCIRSFSSRSRARRSSSVSEPLRALSQYIAQSSADSALLNHTQLGTGSLPALVCLPIFGMHSLNELLSRLLTHQLYSLTQLANCSIPAVMHLLAHPLYSLQSSRRTHRVYSSTRLLSEFRRWFTRFLVSPSSIRC